MGETPNLAARLQGLADPGSVIVAETTRRLLGEVFELTALGPSRQRFRRPDPRLSGRGRDDRRGRFEAHHAVSRRWSVVRRN